MWIGAIVCIIGAAIIILTGLMVIREWVLENIYDWKLSNLKHAYNYEAEMLAVIHLKELKDKYPELEIHYKGEELQEWGD
jgi:hypothetical protein